jgi:hypothetical protein
VKSLLLGLLMALPPGSPGVEASRNFWVESPDPAMGRRMAHDAEQYREQIQKEWFGVEKVWAFPVPIVARVGLGPFESTNGMSVRIPDSKHFDFIRLFAPSEPEVERMLLHEVAHVVLDREVDAPPLWAHEGFAVANEVLLGDYPTRYNDHLGIQPLRDFLRTKWHSHDLTGDEFYGEAGSLTLYLHDRFGPTVYVRWLRSGMAGGFEVACISELGISIDDLERDWLGSLDEMDSPYPRSWRAR